MCVHDSLIHANVFVYICMYVCMYTTYEGQMRLRSTRFWGRLYLDGWPQTIQFFRAHFGIEPPFGKSVRVKYIEYVCICIFTYTIGWNTDICIYIFVYGYIQVRSVSYFQPHETLVVTSKIQKQSLR